MIVVGTHGWYALYLAGQAAGTEYELASCYTSFGHGQNPAGTGFRCTSMATSSTPYS